MAEVGGGTAVDTSIYRQQPQQNPLDMITKVGQAADSLGGLAVGDAVQKALQPDGSIDKNMLANVLKSTQAGSMKAIPTLNALEQLKSAGFAADQAGLETFQKRMAITNHLFSGLASKANPTMSDVYDVGAKALDPALEAHKYGITMPVIMNAIKSFSKGPDGKPLTPAQIKAKALEIQTHAATTGEILNQHSPQVRVVDDNGNIRYEPAGTAAVPDTGVAYPKKLGPATVVPGKTGAQYLGEQPVEGGAVRTGPGSTAPIAPRAVPTTTIRPQTPTGPAAGLPPGYAEAAASTAQTSASIANRLTEANDTSMNRKALLGNMSEMMNHFEPGKGADWTLFAKNFANRNLPVPKSMQAEGGILDLKSVASQEEFNKLAMQLAQAQFSAIGGTGTDSKFASAFETSPNELMSRLGNKNVMRLLNGNEDAIQAKNKAKNKWVKEHGADTLAEFSEQFNEHFDPRAFQFKYLTPKERTDYIAGMEPDEKQRFLHDLTHARKEGWIKFEASGKK